MSERNKLTIISPPYGKRFHEGGYLLFYDEQFIGLLTHKIYVNNPEYDIWYKEYEKLSKEDKYKSNNCPDRLILIEYRVRSLIEISNGEWYPKNLTKDKLTSYSDIVLELIMRNNFHFYSENFFLGEKKEINLNLENKKG